MREGGGGEDGSEDDFMVDPLSGVGHFYGNPAADASLEDDEGGLRDVWEEQVRGQEMDRRHRENRPQLLCRSPFPDLPCESAYISGRIACLSYP